MKKRVFQLLLCLPFVFATSLLQAQNSSAELWTGFEFEKRLHKRVDWETGTEIRLTTWEKTFKSWLLESGFTFEANKYLRFSPGYRFTYQQTGVAHRADITAQLRYRKKPWALAYNLKFQSDFERDEPTAEHALRNKLSADLWLNKRATAYLGGEIFYQIWYKPNLFNEYRIFAGIELDKKDHVVKIGYILQKEFNVFAPGTAHVISIAYSLSK